MKSTEIGKFAHFKVERKRACCSYNHHFVLLEILKGPKECKEKDIIEVVVGHYTSSIEICTNNSNFGIGKFVCEIKQIKRNGKCDLFDFSRKSSGLFLVKHEPSMSDNKRQERLCERLGERDYDFRHNNCEHVINYIISGDQQSDEADENSFCADLCTTTIGDIKEVGLKVALIIAFDSSLAGSLIRYSYVSLIVAGTILYTSREGVNGTCSPPKWNHLPFGKNVIEHAKHVLEHHIKLNLLDDPSGERIIADIESTFDEAFICKIAFDLASDAILKTIYFSILVAMSVESFFLIIKIHITFFPLCKKHRGPLCKNKKGPLFQSQQRSRCCSWCFTWCCCNSRILWRKIIVRVYAGYSSICVGISCGFLGQAIFSPPAVYYFIFNLISSVVSRYIFSIFMGRLFDCLYTCCCKDCGKDDRDNIHKRCKTASRDCCIETICCRKKKDNHSASTGSCCCLSNCFSRCRNGYSGIDRSHESTCKCICLSKSCLARNICFIVLIGICIVGVVYPCIRYLD